MRWPGRAQPGPTALTVALVALVLLARLLLVGIFASPVPYFDQWDAEGGNLLRPWLQGTLQAGDFFVAHNEHRVVVTRLLALALFRANDGEWDNLVEACANAFLFAGLIGLVFVGLHRGAQDSRGRVVGCVLLALLGVLPYAWENALVGFQSQFYAMFLCAVGMLVVACRSRLGWSAVAGLIALGLVGLFTMAGGLLGSAAAVGALLMRWRDEKLPRRPLCVALVLLLACAALGLSLVPAVPWHAGMKAQDVGDFMHALAAVLFWPFAPRAHEHIQVRWICAVLLWLPSMTFAVAWLRGHRATPGERLAFALAAWTLAQAVGTAYARGHGMTWVWSRYMEIPALACASNGFLAMRWSLGINATRRQRIATGAWMTVFVAALLLRTGYDMALLRQAATGLQAQRANTLAYLIGRDPAFLSKPVPEVPYPDPVRLRSYLDDPVIQGILPAAIRPASLPPARGRLSKAAAWWQAWVRGWKVVPSSTTWLSPQGNRCIGGAIS